MTRAAAQAVHALTHPSNLTSPKASSPCGSGTVYAATPSTLGAGLTRGGSYRVPSRSIA